MLQNKDGDIAELQQTIHKSMEEDAASLLEENVEQKQQLNRTLEAKTAVENENNQLRKILSTLPTHEEWKKINKELIELKKRVHDPNFVQQPQLHYSHTVPMKLQRESTAPDNIHPAYEEELITLENVHLFLLSNLLLD